ncbi:MAG: ABC transporter ATP-binding protein/permease [Alphaproteobacteria bacterium]|nr:ABC transporter ATP-binding protein/permease [Alphaproteobacteria bacterium]
MTDTTVPVTLKPKRGVLRSLWRLTWPYFYSEERWLARGLAVVVIALAVFSVFIDVKINTWYGRFYNALQEYAWSTFWWEILIFTGLAFAGLAGAVLQLYLRLYLLLRWRVWLTARYLNDWLRDRAYYTLQMRGSATDNPDQRIAEDVDSYISQTELLFLGLLDAVMTLVSFSVILWTLSGPMAVPLFGREVTVYGYMFWIALVYAIGGTILTHLIGRPLISLNFIRQRLEADFRYSMVRLRENAEGVALYGGEGDERVVFNRRFDKVIDNFWAIIMRQVKIVTFTNVYGQASVIVPFLAAAPQYFITRTFQLGGLMQTVSAFGRVQNAMSWFINAYISIANWRAAVDRLTTFTDALDAAHETDKTPGGIAVSTGADNKLNVSGVVLGLPNGQTLTKAIDLSVAPGESVLVRGPSGVGKSTLFRTLAGLWKFGAGTVQLPATGRVLFLPQRPYLPLGTLRLAVSYPAPPDGYSDAEVVGALRTVGLHHLVDRLDEESNWAQTLSQGEQQRVAFARTLLNKPDWLFMDEATAALDEKTESALYRLVRQRLPGAAIVSIGHRPSLAEHHDRTLEIHPAAEPQPLAAE